MRWLSMVLVFLLAMPAYAGENEAEKVFRQMEKKLTGAKTIKVRCESTITTMKGARTATSKSKYTLVFGENNKAFWEAEDELLGDKGGKAVIISNGNKFYTGDNGVSDIKDTPKTVGSLGRAALARGWSQHAQIQSLTVAFALEERGEQLPDDFWMMSNFKLGAKEKLGIAETRIIEYTFLEPGQENKIKYSVKVWIDIQTHLHVSEVDLGARTDGAGRFWLGRADH